ncbi:MFS transporter [Granulicella mallensis]|uniref:Major facilitator superfamily MFS_1 n=1 Tax=Granulicella mallensis (strain ATCC BAA-1857 / DSM 23137 / MP5ACTX8) TaxID=682795 RepID=G8NP21_GRAMM|nr:MFS transporter [Granulicella mallensis]AEU37125.1 major facilitator superfamily MFS_1 [Granulicella mallensis MP5ACTX8]
MSEPGITILPTRKKLWFLQLESEERSALVATFAGWMLDGMDVMVYSFVLPSLILIWHISKGQAGLLGTSALLLSSVGGWLAGLAADRFGRVRILRLTILWFAVFTFLSGFTNSFNQLFIIRGLQGLGFGGEWAVGSVLIGETIRAKYRGRAVGTVQGGWAIGWGIAALFYTLFFAVLSPDMAWRAMFWIGLAPVVLAVYVRKNVQEPEIYKEATILRANHPSTNKGSNLTFLKIFSPAILRTTALASLVALGAQGGYYAINTWLPLYLNARGLNVTHTGGYLLVVILGSFAGYLVSAHLADRLGRKLTLILFAAFSALTIFLYTIVPISDTATLLLGFPLGFFPSGSFSPMGAFFTELFPTAIRGSAQGFSYNLGRGVGALFPALVGFFAIHMRLGHAIALFAVSAYLLMTLGVLLLPETCGVELEENKKNAIV